MTTDFRALCAELIDAIDAECKERTIGYKLMNAYIQACAALAAETLADLGRSALPQPTTTTTTETTDEH